MPSKAHKAPHRKAAAPQPKPKPKPKPKPVAVKPPPKPKAPVLPIVPDDQAPPPDATL